LGKEGDVTTTYYADEEVRPRKRRGRRALISLLVLLVVLAGVLFAADRVAANFAEKKIAEQVTKEVAAQNAQAAPPDVTVGGFPFLTQVLAGNYEHIKIVMHDVKGSVNGDSVSLPQLDVNARDVKASIDTLRTGQGDVVAKTVDGAATISYASVVELIKQPGLKLSESNGKLLASAPVSFLNQKFTLTGTAGLTVTKGQIQIKFEDVTAEGLPPVPLAQQLIDNVAKNISINVALPDLPFQLDVQKVTPTPAGLSVTAAANNVPINAAR
jgi:hypothetical protein